ncbi:hypothetical protein AB205_0179130 [Aquarana catesbeiana]|uniref:Uncharacterized protein n=1 Tax=Aquarana catesbeiana TaxID=8400 RepID=A0A2G9RJH8_AQUCT|nr:hypothetical protein AB205_0179130 [Aquarana catesbeiana]
MENLWDPGSVASMHVLEAHLCFKFLLAQILLP